MSTNAETRSRPTYDEVFARRALLVEGLQQKAEAQRVHEIYEHLRAAIGPALNEHTIRDDLKYLAEKKVVRAAYKQGREFFYEVVDAARLERLRERGRRQRRVPQRGTVAAAKPKRGRPTNAAVAAVKMNRRTRRLAKQSTAGTAEGTFLHTKWQQITGVELTADQVIEMLVAVLTIRHV